MKIEDIEQYYETKFAEKIQVINAKQKAVNNIADLESRIKNETIERDSYIITRPIRNTSMFGNKCKYHEGSCINEIDRLYFSKYGTCYNCYVMYEER